MNMQALGITIVQKEPELDVLCFAVMVLRVGMLGQGCVSYM